MNSQKSLARLSSIRSVLPVQLLRKLTDSIIKVAILIFVLGPLCIISALELAASESGLGEQQARFKEFTPENFDLGGELSHYLWQNFSAFYPHAEISRTGAIRALPENFRKDVAAHKVNSNLGPMTLGDYVKTEPHIDGIVVLHKGQIVYEAYPNLKPYQKHLAWSVTKVVVSTALAILQNQGKLNTMLPIERYLPELEGTAWASTSVQNIINMASGMDCLDSDGYQKTNTCVYRYEESLGVTARKNEPVTTLEHIQEIKRRGIPGEKNEYASVNTYVLGLLLEAITDKPLWIALQDLVWSKIGAEADALFTISPKGNAYSSGGLNARLRDIARFGELFTTKDGLKVIGKRHLHDLKSGNIISFQSSQKEEFAKQFVKDIPSHAAWQWDMIWPDGDMHKSGYSGQGIFVSPERQLVIAYFGTHSKDWEEHELLSISRQLSRSGLF